jgi:hypothetical protein
VPALCWDPQPDIVAVLTRRAVIAIPLDINPIGRICPKSPSTLQTPY